MEVTADFRDVLELLSRRHLPFLSFGGSREQLKGKRQGGDDHDQLDDDDDHHPDSLPAKRPIELATDALGNDVAADHGLP